MRLLLIVLVILSACAPVEVIPENVSINVSDDMGNADEVIINETNSTDEIPEEIAEEIEGIMERNESANLSRDVVFNPDESYVRFWLGTRKGAVQDILSEGTVKEYVLGNSTYTLRVIFIGRGDSGMGEVLFGVNNKLTKVLDEEQDTDVFQPGEFILVREIWYRR